MNQVIRDPIFGELNSEEIPWMGRAFVPMFGTSVPVMVETLELDPSKAELPTAEQQNAFTALRQLDRSFLDAAYDAVFRHYVEVADSYRRYAVPEERVDLTVPHLNDASEIRGLMSSPSVYVPVQPPGVRRIVMLNWDCSWDLDQGIRVMVENEKVKQVMGQGDGWE